MYITLNYMCINKTGQSSFTPQSEHNKSNINKPFTWPRKSKHGMHTGSNENNKMLTYSAIILLYYTLRFYFPYLSLLAQPVTIFVYGPVTVLEYGPARYLHYYFR